MSVTLDECAAKISRLGMVYLATPYTRYPGGPKQAFLLACRATAALMRYGVSDVYSPIAHSHPIATYGELDPLDWNIWKPSNDSMMERAGALVVVKMNGWRESIGVKHEIETFKQYEKPIFYVPASICFYRHKS